MAEQVVGLDEEARDGVLLLSAPIAQLVGAAAALSLTAAAALRLAAEEDVPVGAEVACFGLVDRKEYGADLNLTRVERRWNPFDLGQLRSGLLDRRG